MTTGSSTDWATPAGKLTLSTTTTTIGSDLIGRRVIVRSRISGVSIGRLVALDLATNTVELRKAWRLWGWSDGAFTLSEIARVGATCRVDKHPKSVVITDTGLEILPVSGKAWAAIKDRWTIGAQ